MDTFLVIIMFKICLYILYVQINLLYMSNAAILKKVHDVGSYILLIFQSTLRQINISVKASKYRGLMTRIFHFFNSFLGGSGGGVI